MTEKELEAKVAEQHKFILQLADRLYICYEILARLAECEIRKHNSDVPHAERIH